MVPTPLAIGPTVAARAFVGALWNVVEGHQHRVIPQSFADLAEVVEAITDTSRRPARR
jgi:hypothetical protein